MTFITQSLMRAKQQAECFEYCMTQARVQFEYKEYDKAVAYLKNAIRSLEELETIQNEDKAVDEVVDILQSVNQPFEVLNELVQKLNKKALSSREANLA